MEKRLFISFSGGETSAFMTQWILDNWRDKYDEFRVVFANTGQENEETLEFVQKFSEHFGVDVVWVEGVIHEGQRKGTTHKIVDFHSADRSGASTFEPMIKKYGIPNMAMPHCTRELKVNPMKSYMRSIGWKKYDTAIGIRCDEIDRMSADMDKKRLIYPLVNLGVRKKDINEFWEGMPFRLNLKGYQGNCKWCWKKTIRKHCQIITENPAAYDFPERMERENGMCGALASKTGEMQRFFRQKLSVQNLRDIAAKGFSQPEDDSVSYGGKQIEMNLSAGCIESCEVEM